MWDIASGRNELVHFGARIRNSREGELKPVLAPRETAGGSGMRSGREMVFWPNDDGRGEIFVHEVSEGALVRVLKTKNVVQVLGAVGKGRARSKVKGPGVKRLTSGGRINALAWRPVTGEEGALEMYSAHGDGRICAWIPSMGEEKGEEERSGEDSDEDGESGVEMTREQRQEEASRKRKRDLLEGLVQGLTKKPITFS